MTAPGHRPARRRKLRLSLDRPLDALVARCAVAGRPGARATHLQRVSSFVSLSAPRMRASLHSAIRRRSLAPWRRSPSEAFAAKSLDGQSRPVARPRRSWRSRAPSTGPTVVAERVERDGESAICSKPPARHGPACPPARPTPSTALGTGPAATTGRQCVGGRLIGVELRSGCIQVTSHVDGALGRSAPHR